MSWAALEMAGASMWDRRCNRSLVRIATVVSYCLMFHFPGLAARTVDRPLTEYSAARRPRYPVFLRATSYRAENDA